MTTYNPYAYQGYEVIKTSLDHKKGNTNSTQIYKWIFSLLVIVLIITSLYLITAAAGSSSSQFAVLDGESVVTVSTGDTLWNIASRHYEHKDLNFIVFLIKQRNGLESDLIKPGEQLILPELP